jgi:MFS family permease
MSVLGPLSDQLGRKPIIIGSVTLFIITFMLRTYAVYAGVTLYWYLLFCAVEGLAGCHYTFDVACLAILANYSAVNNKFHVPCPIRGQALNLIICCTG